MLLKSLPGEIDQGTFCRRESGEKNTRLHHTVVPFFPLLLFSPTSGWGQDWAWRGRRLDGGELMRPRWGWGTVFNLVPPFSSSAPPLPSPLRESVNRFNFRSGLSPRTCGEGEGMDAYHMRGEHRKYRVQGTIPLRPRDPDSREVLRGGEKGCCAQITRGVL